MSYRTFKHLIGETSLERKCRFIFGAGVLILITGSFFWYGRKSEAMVYDQNKVACRLLANNILLRHHWIKLETFPDFRPVIDTLDVAFGEMVPGDVKRYQSKFIKLGDPEHAPANEFEYEAFESFQKGERDERWRFVPGESTYQYLAALRVKQECLVCHPASKSRIMKEGDLWAAVSVSIPLDRTQAEINANRKILISTAVITAGLAMIVFYVIVRYVIAKPLKHLKDVSDAVAAGNLDVRADIET